MSVRLHVIVEFHGVYFGGVPFDQLHDQARKEALYAIQRGLDFRSVQHVELIGEPIVVSISVEEQ